MSATLETADRKVGDPVWIFDQNRRVYRKDANGKSLSGGPIWREHWAKKKVTSETSRSWVVGENGWDQHKIPKKGPTPYGICWSEEELDQLSYVADHKHKISDAVQRLTDYDTLKRVADLVGFKAD